MSTNSKYDISRFLIHSICLFACATYANTSIAASHSILPYGQHLVVDVGGFSAHQGKSQNVEIVDLIGDHFSVTDANDQNILFGLGYYIDGICDNRYTLMYGVEAYYLTHTTVKGDITQEQLFTNLSYKYSLTNIPVYLSGKALVRFNSSMYAMTLNVGVGANFIRANDYEEQSLDGGVTIPGNTFSGQNTTVFSATAGLGIQFDHLLFQLPVEFRYQFFYLNEASLQKGNQVINNLKTGNSYANALMINVSLT